MIWLIDMMVLKTCKWYDTKLFACLWCVDWYPVWPYQIKFWSWPKKVIKYHFIFNDLWWPQYWPDPKNMILKSRIKSFNGLSNTVWRLSLRFVVFEIWRGAEKGPSPISNLSEPTRNGVKISKYCFYHLGGRWLPSILAKTVKEQCHLLSVCFICYYYPCQIWKNVLYHICKCNLRSGNRIDPVNVLQL